MIKNCTKASLTNDVCETCTSGYMLSSNGLNCFNVVMNCKDYLENAVATSISCINCIEGYYLTSANICEQGNIPNCKTYN